MDTPAFWHHLVDDAAIFPPGNAPLDEAIKAHREHRRAEYADLVGTFVLSDGRLPELCDLVGEDDPIAISLVVTGGAGALTGAITWADRAAQVELAGLEIALRDPVESVELAHNARRVTAALDDVGADQIATFVELPRVPHGPTPSWLAALDVIAEHGLNAKFRLGGVEPGMVPSSAELSAVIAAALDREVAFKCTAGLHQAIRHGDGDDAQHGFLNVLVATRAELDGGDPVAALEERDPAALLEGIEVEALARTRHWFRSFGSCSILEPHHDLVELELM